MKALNIILLAIATIFGVTNARPITSMFLAAFDPVAMAKEAMDRLDKDFSENTDQMIENISAHNEATQNIQNVDAKIEFVSPQSAEDSEIQKLATEFLLIIKALKEVSKEEAKEVLQIIPSK
ncbi:putative integral membrane protein [Cryptosporidium canis]|uniref:Integral membrane protein n=1 Tax=Cryptosporidium canis TaxID=195482 RepID=A0A9D5DLC4_9CRYT|nr:putative integral membrane protein [Cryptosporidium canis]